VCDKWCHLQLVELLHALGELTRVSTDISQHLCVFKTPLSPCTPCRQPERTEFEDILKTAVLQCAALRAMCCSKLQCVAPRDAHLATTSSSVLQCVAVCCSMLQCVAVCCSANLRVKVICRVLHRNKLTSQPQPRVAVCCSVLQCVALRCHMLQYVAPQQARHATLTSCALHCVAVCCLVLPCDAL